MKKLTFALAALLACPVFLPADEADDEQAAKDAVVIEALKRLENVDLSAKPKTKAALLRHLNRNQGTAEFVELAERFGVRETADELLRLAAEKPDSTLGVNAAGLLLKFGEQAKLRSALQADNEQAAKVAAALGFVTSNAATELLKPLVTDTKRPLPVRRAAVDGIGRTKAGPQWLLDLVRKSQLPPDLNFAAANILLASPDEALRTEAAKHLSLPATANAQPLPPIAELVTRQGNAEQGRTIFLNKGTCSKCHKVGAEGKEVGPNLSEIGGKLSREALYVSILDPSAGISHNYETYVLVLESGNVLSGILVSQTPETVTIRTAEAIEKAIPAAEIEELKKSKISLMPADLQKNLTVEDLVNVVEFLTTLKAPGK